MSRITDPFYLDLSMDDRSRFRVRMHRHPRKNEVTRPELIDLVKDEWKHNGLSVVSDSTVSEEASESVEAMVINGNTPFVSSASSDDSVVTGDEEMKQTEADSDSPEDVSGQSVPEEEFAFEDPSTANITRRRSFLEWVSENTKGRYFGAKLLFYAAVIPTSSRALYYNFADINLYGHDYLNFGFALILTATVDFLAIDLLFRIRFSVSGILSFLVGLTLVFGNVYLANQTFERVEDTDYLQVHAENLREKKLEYSEASRSMGAAWGTYLIAKWPREIDRELCERDEGRCSTLPFRQKSEPQYIDFMAAKGDFQRIKQELANLRQMNIKKPESSQKQIKNKLMIYSALWGLIALCIFMHLDIKRRQQRDLLKHEKENTHAMVS